MDLLHNEDYINALGALTGNQAVQQVKAGLKAIYLSGWQVAADANLSGHTYPDQSLYPANSVPHGGPPHQQRAAARRPDRRSRANQSVEDWLAPIVADAEAGFGGALNAYELMKAMIAAGAAGVHWEDQLASEKKCGHLGGKVLIPTQQHVRTLNAARLAADVAGRPDRRHRPHRRRGRHPDHLRRRRARPRSSSPASRTAEGFYGSATASSPASPAPRPTRRTPTSSGWRPASPDLELARKFAEAVKAEFPDQMLAYNCSPSFNWSSTWTTPPSRSSSANSARWASSSSSSPWPASTP